MQTVDYICKGEYSMERYLGAKIKELRQSRNWTQAYLAERLNKSVSTVSGYESDAHPVERILCSNSRGCVNLIAFSPPVMRCNQYFFFSTISFSPSSLSGTTIIYFTFISVHVTKS